MTRRRAHAVLRGPVLTVALLIGVLPAAVAEARFGDEPLSKGDTGKDVRSLQRFLDRAGYETGVDGIFGRHTQKRVRAFEGNEERRVDGRVDGRVTRSDARVLKAAAARAADGPAPADEPAATQETPGATATLGEDGLATAPAGAPPQVKAVIAAGNEIAKKPYKYGGGHAKERDTGYDCSGSLSYALREAGLMKGSMASSGFMRFGEPGRGEWITIRANSAHAYMMVAGLRFDTSARKQSATRWSEKMRSARGYRGRHPSGF